MNDCKIKLVAKKKVGCKVRPSLAISANDLTNAGFEMGDNALIEIEQNKIIIRRTKPKKNVVIMKQLCIENPHIQRLIDSLDLVLL